MLFRSVPAIFYAQLAQLVEQRTENPRVSGSIPELGIKDKISYGCVAQLVEHLTFNQVVPGSNPGTLTVRNAKAFLFLLYRKVRFLPTS